MSTGFHIRRKIHDQFVRWGLRHAIDHKGVMCSRFRGMRIHNAIATIGLWGA